MGIVAVHAQVAGNSSSVIFAGLQGETTPTATFPPTSTLPPTGTPDVSSSTGSSSAGIDVYTFVQAPTGHVARPYVILSAFTSAFTNGPITIRGSIDSQEFICSETPCVIYLDGSARLVFRGTTASGINSADMIASVNVAIDPQGYLVTIDSVNQFTSFVDSCSLVWGVRDEEDASWNDFVQSPYQLNTNKTLHALATKLILFGVVTADDCPAGGLNSGLNWPTACGLEKTTDKMIEWQNRFDGAIWTASKEYGVPPKILKSLIEYESQFWPGNSRFFLDEIGLGQINQLGIDVLLRRDPTVYQQVCGVISSCDVPYIRLDANQQGLIRGALMKSVDATCPSCEYGLDLNKASDSISLIANLLRANCRQVGEILGGDIENATYEDLWRFTLGTYHSGGSCFQDAVDDVRLDDKKVTWDNLENKLNCGKGGDYVNGLMDNLFVFDRYSYQNVDANNVMVAPTIVPTRTPIPTPTVYVSTAIVKVQVYMDRNGNGVPDQNEWLDGMSVRLKTTSNEELNSRTENGVALFDMTGYSPGLGINVSLPGLYRSDDFILPEQGEILVIFKFDQPALPTILP